MRRQPWLGRVEGASSVYFTQRVLGAALAMGLCVGMVACGAGGGGAPLRLDGGAITPSPAASVSPSASATAPSSPANPASGVTITLDHAHYAPTDTLGLTIHNGLATTVYVETNHSDCEVVTLERLVNGVWVVAAGCSGALPAPQIEAIAPGGTLQQAIAPERGGPVGGSAGAAWPVGVYRAELRYVTSQSQPIAQGTVVDSASCSVG